MTLSSPVTELKGVGDALAKRFAVRGIHTLGDLIDYFPRRYDDFSDVTPVAQLRPGAVSIAATIKQAKGRYVRRGMHITEAVASDETGSVRLIWFNQPYREAALKHDQQYFISGQYELSHQRFALMNPSVELASDLPVNTARIVPIYRETKGLTSRQIRAAMVQLRPLISHVPETLPDWVVKDHQLLSRAAALMALHFPASREDLLAARRRLGFEEVFGLSLASLLNKQKLLLEKSPEVPFNADLAKRFVEHLPFQLTDAQKRVVWQIYQDLQRPHPMNRLVEGDVGSGKTVVATMAALMAIEQGYQAAFMAPTELLARQHADTIFKLLEPLGYEQHVTLLTGSLKTAQKKAARAAIADGRARFIIGTQALIQEQVNMQSLALVVIDEQHRFGVDQRTELQVKAGHMPHVLSLTATPIPRSLALTLYGELDVSIINMKPVGRLPIITKLVSPNSRKQLFEAVNEQLDAGRQMFVVCPLITASGEADQEPGLAPKDVSAEATYERLRKGELKNRRVGLLHGKMKADEKNRIMDEFVTGKLDVLVATTVIEVGVDVPNATVMLIEAPERFGLAQLHQLRGRVGRSGHQGYCYLMLSDSKAPSKRLRALESSNDGFRLAELDLELRGPGAIYGTLQHGQLDLRMARLTDTELIAEAREAAKHLLETGEDLLQYKELADNVKRLQAVTNLN